MDESQLRLEELAKRLGSSLKNGLTLSKVKDLKSKDKSEKHHDNSTVSLLLPFHQISTYMSLYVLLKGLVAVSFFVVVKFFGDSLIYYLIGGLLVLEVLIEGLLVYAYHVYKVNLTLKMMKKKRNKLLVLREGVSYSVFSGEILLGDVVMLRVGDVVPADMRIIEAVSLKVGSSSMTGKSVVLSKGVGGDDDDDVVTHGGGGDDDYKMLHTSDVVVEGTAKGMVVIKDTQSKLGHITKTRSILTRPPGVVSQEFHHIFLITALSSAVLWFVTFVALFVLGYNFFDGFFIPLYVCLINIADTIISLFAVTQCMFAHRMMNKGVLIKDVRSLLALSKTTIIVSDKTGTLTTNKSIVRHVYLSNLLTCTTENNLIDRRSEAWNALSRVAMLCNEAVFVNQHEKVAIEERECAGNKYDVALLRFFESEVGDVDDFRRKFPRHNKLPIHLHHSLQASVNEVQGQGNVLSIKGSPKVLLNCCSSILIGDKHEPISPEHLALFNNTCTQLEALGEDLTAFCDVVLEDFKEGGSEKRGGVKEMGGFPSGGYRLLGMVGMVDALREGTIQAVDEWRRAGIKVIMVTGDNQMKAKAVATETNIVTNHVQAATENSILLAQTAITASNHHILEGFQIRGMTTAQVNTILCYTQEVLCTAMSPYDKLQVVQSLKIAGKTVMMIGDGVNDVMAMKVADVGVTLGASNNDLTTSTADVVVVEGGFGGLLEVMRQGHLLRTNLKKMLVLVLSSTLPFILAFLLFAFFQIPSLTPQCSLLVVKYAIDFLMAVALAYEEEEEYTDDGGNDGCESGGKGGGKEGVVVKGRLGRCVSGVRRVEGDMLLNHRSLNIALGQTGVIEFLAGFFSYLAVMASHGFIPSRLWGINDVWYSDLHNDVVDFYGQEWSRPQRQVLEQTAQTVFFVTIVVLQLINGVMCKTRFISVIHQGMHNHYLTFALFFNVTLIIIMIYLPPLRLIFELVPPSLTHWLLPLPFCLLLIGLEELRKSIIRKNPQGWLFNESYY